MLTTSRALSTVWDLTSDAGSCTGAYDLSTRFEMGEYLTEEDGDTSLHPIKSLDSSVVTIFNSWETTGIAVRRLQAWKANSLGEITDISGPTGRIPTKDVSNVLSTAAEIIPGIPHNGEFSITLNWEATSTGNYFLLDAMNNQTKRDYVIVFPDKPGDSSSYYPTWINFEGYILEYSVSAAIDTKITANCVIGINGPVHWTKKNT